MYRQNQNVHPSIRRPFSGKIRRMMRYWKLVVDLVVLLDKCHVLSNILWSNISHNELLVVLQDKVLGAVLLRYLDPVVTADPVPGD